MASSHSSSSPSTALLHVNITDFVTEKLDMTNYLTWSYLFKPILDIHDINDHISSQPTTPEQTLLSSDGKTSTPNPDFLSWVKIDKIILSWINATVKREVLPLLYHSRTASDAWFALETHFLDKSTARELQLKFTLNKLVKGTLSIDEYCQRFKEISDALAAIKQPLTDREQVSRILQGLPSSYESLITVASNQKPSPTFAELWTMLLSHEARLANIDSLSSGTPATALVSTYSSDHQSSSHYPGQRGRGSYRGRGRANRGRGRGSFFPLYS